MATHVQLAQQFGDLIAKETGLEVVKRIDDGTVSYTKVSIETRINYERLPVVASD